MAPRKRKSLKTAVTAGNKRQKTESLAELNLYFRTYKKGSGDIHWPIFSALKNIVKPQRVLYPGCHRHITASLVFNDVVYVDNYAKVETCYSDSKVLEWIKENKEYTEEPEIKFLCKNFESGFGEKIESFDLVMSLSAGIVSTSCSKYVKKNGYFFVSDAHFDARLIYLDPNFKLTHVWNRSEKCFESDEEALSGHFMTTDGTPISESQVNESMEKQKTRRSFKLQKESLFYLFKKVS